MNALQLFYNPKTQSLRLCASFPKTLHTNPINPRVHTELQQIPTSWSKPNQTKKKLCSEPFNAHIPQHGQDHFKTRIKITEMRNVAYGSFFLFI